MLLFLQWTIGVVCHIKYLAWCGGCTVDYWWCLLFGLVWTMFIGQWIIVVIYLVHCGLGDFDSGLVVLFVIYIIWLSVVIYLVHCGLGGLDSGLSVACHIHNLA